MTAARSQRRVAFVAVCSLATLHLLVYLRFFTENVGWSGIAFYEFTACFAVPVVFLRMRASSGKDRLGWLVMTVAVAATAVLDTGWSIADQAMAGGIGYPNWFDPFYLSSYVAYIVAVGLLTSPLWRGRDRRWMFDAGALMAISAGLLWHFVIPRTGDGSVLTSLLGCTYLVFDLCFFGTVLTAAYTSRLTVRNALVMAAATILATGDVLYYFEAIAFDASWLAGIWIVVIAATVDQNRAIRMPRLRFARAGAIPYVFVAAVGLVTLEEMRRGSADALLLTAVVALALIVARQIITLRRALA
ncbi:MAG: hypothetical protein ABI577_17175, partial [bacterium]